MNIFKCHSRLVSSRIARPIFCCLLLAQGLGQLKDVAAQSEIGQSASSLESLETVAAGSAGNAAGAIEFCMKNNYLSGEGAASVKDRLLQKMISSGEQSAETNPDYISGAKGIVCCGSGPSVDLSTASLKAPAVKKACEKILEQGKSMF